MLSNVYLTEVDGMLERAKAVTRYQQWTYVEYARFADDLVVLVDAHPRQRWLCTAVEQRLREELAKLQVEVNEEKSRRVDLTQGESFGFLGFEFRRIRSRRGRWMPLRTPRGKKRTALRQTLKQVFRSHRSRLSFAKTRPAPLSPISALCLSGRVPHCESGRRTTDHIFRDAHQRGTAPVESAAIAPKEQVVVMDELATPTPYIKDTNRVAQDVVS